MLKFVLASCFLLVVASQAGQATSQPVNKLKEFEGEYRNTEVTLKTNNNKLDVDSYKWTIYAQDEPNSATVGFRVLNNVQSNLQSNGKDERGHLAKMSAISTTLIGSNSEKLTQDEGRLTGILGNVERIRRVDADHIILESQEAIVLLKKSK